MLTEIDFGYGIVEWDDNEDNFCISVPNDSGYHDFVLFPKEALSSLMETLNRIYIFSKTGHMMPPNK